MVLLKMLSNAWRGSRSLRTTKAITIPTSCLIQRLKDMYGMSDQRMLMSMKPISKNNQVFFFMALDQSNCLLASINRPRHKNPLWKYRSNGLPDSAPPPTDDGNQTPKGLLAMRSIQMVGIHWAQDTWVACLRSSLSRKSTKTIQKNNASGGGMIS